MTKPESKSDESLTWTYVGRRITKGKTVRHCFVELDEPDTLRWLNKVKASKFQGCVIGREYKIGDYLPDIWSAVETGREAGAETRVAWQARDRATEMQQRQNSVKTSPELDSIVDQLKNYRLKLSPVQRVGFDAWLLNTIR